ncbi:hypothetical protein BJX64DRAFT_207850 [Aspergillus heterothallicus]
MDQGSILSAGSIELMIEDPDYAVESCPPPIVQCLLVKPISSTPNGVTRWRAVLGDGKNWIQTMLVTLLSHLVDDGDLVKGSICRIKKYMPTQIRGKTIFVILDLEVIPELGILERIGTPMPLESAPQQNEEYHVFRARKDCFVPSWRLISRFPLEIFDMIVANLPQRDKLALALTSKKLYELVRPSTYSTMVLRNKNDLVRFSDVLVREPEIRSFVRACLLKGDVCCLDAEAFDFHTDAITSLPLLRHLSFVPADEVTSACSIISIIQKLVSDKVFQSLRSFHIDLNCRYAFDLPTSIQEKILQAMFSAPLIRHLEVSYCHRDHEEFSHRIIREVTNLRLKKAVAKATALRSLILQWDGLPVMLLSTILRCPRNLESLTLRFSGRYDHAIWGPAITLDCALSPITESLQDLELDFVHRIAENTPEAVGLLWGGNGLTSFTKLHHLRISAIFLTEVQGFDGKRPWLPYSLISLCITTSELFHCSKPEPNTESTPSGPRLVRGEHFLYFDQATTRALNTISDSLVSTPNLSQMIVKSEGHGYGAYQRSFICRYPPIVLLGEALQPLVDRNIRVGLEFDEAANVWLGVTVAPGF